MDDRLKQIVGLKEQGKSYAEIGRIMKCSSTGVRDKYKRWAQKEGFPTSTKAQIRGGGAVSLTRLQSVEDFLKPYDWVGLLREGIKKIPQGSVIRDEDFRRELRVPDNKWATIKKLPEFSKVQLRVGPTSQLIWGQPATLEKVRRRIDLTDTI